MKKNTKKTHILGAQTTHLTSFGPICWHHCHCSPSCGGHFFLMLLSWLLWLLWLWLKSVVVVEVSGSNWVTSERVRSLRPTLNMVWHRYGSHHGISVTGVTGTGPVSKIQTWGHTATCHRGVMGFHGSQVYIITSPIYRTHSFERHLDRVLLTVP